MKTNKVDKRTKGICGWISLLLPVTKLKPLRHSQFISFTKAKIGNTQGGQVIMQRSMLSYTSRQAGSFTIIHCPVLFSFLECNCTANQTVANTTCNARSGQCDCRVSLAGGRYGGRQCEGCAKHTVGKF